MTDEQTRKKDTALWTPWGSQQPAKPGEKFAALRRLAKRLRSVRKKKMAKPAVAGS
nr:hypothetical protein [Mesorhizobium loti]